MISLEADWGVCISEKNGHVLLSAFVSIALLSCEPLQKDPRFFIGAPKEAKIYGEAVQDGVAQDSHGSFFFFFFFGGGGVVGRAYDEPAFLDDQWAA